MSECPHCGQTLPEKRSLEGTHLTPYQQRIFEIVRRAGANGIMTNDLFDKLYAEDPNGGPLTGRKSLYAMIRALNFKLEAHRLCVRASPNGQRAAWSYVLRMLPL